MLGTNNSKRSLFFCVVSAIGLACSTAFMTTTTATTKSSVLYGSDMGYDENANYEDDNSNNYDNNISTNNNDLLLLREFLQEHYPTFYSILDMNEEVWKAIGDTEDDAEVGFTVFAPSALALQELGEAKQTQLLDERNKETTQKIVGYHVIKEPVSAEALFESGGVMTVAGEVPIERSMSGGFFGVGGKEDGGVTLNQAKVLRTAYVGSGLVHEVDNLVSPNILWRYMDQLRIPGST